MKFQDNRLKTFSYLFALILLTSFLSLMLFLLLRLAISNFWQYSQSDLISDNITFDVAPERKLILLISLDGMGSDLIGEDTPYLSSLLQRSQSSATLDMQSLMQSETMPAHLSMVTGLTQEHHGFYENSVDETTPVLTTKTIFDHAKTKGYKYYGFVTKDKLLYLFGTNQNENIISIEDGSGDVLKDIDNLINADASRILTFVHFRDADKYGHLLGWGSLGQRAAIRILDNNLRQFITDINYEFANYERYIIITADHGGEGLTHGSGCTSCRRIPLLVVSENRDESYKLDARPYNIYDVACVVMDLIGNQEDLNMDCE